MIQLNITLLRLGSTHTNLKLAFVIFATIIAALTFSPHSISAEFKSSDKVYVISSVATVRSEPLDSAPVSAKLPIGTYANFVGSPSEVSKRPDVTCKGADSQRGSKWACVCIGEFEIGYGAQWCGWISAELLSQVPPKLTNLISQYDSTSPSELLERRKWAERAAAIDPMSSESQSRLLDVLEKLADTKALEFAKRSFNSYSTNKLRSNTSDKLVFAYMGGFLEPIAEVKGGRLVFRNFDQDKNYEFRNPGHFYNFYSDGKKTGTVVTEAQFDCRLKTCPLQTLGRIASSNGLSPEGMGIVTNFGLSEEGEFPRKITERDKSILLKLAITWLDSSRIAPEVKSALKKYFERNLSEAKLSVGKLADDGRLMLIGNWAIGSMNDRHYGDSDDIYESLLIIAEEQQDGSFRLAAGSGSLSDSGCSYFDHLDINVDGTDDLFLRCEQLEGQYSYALVKRVDSKWQITYGPSLPE